MISLCAQGEYVYGTLAADRAAELATRWQSVDKRVRAFFRIVHRYEYNWASLCQGLVHGVRLGVGPRRLAAFRFNGRDANVVAAEIKKALRWFRLAGDREIKNVSVMSAEMFALTRCSINEIKLAIVADQLERESALISRMQTRKAIPAQSKITITTKISEVLCIKPAQVKHLE